MMAHNPGKARKIAQKAIWDAAWVKNHPPDLINVALERLVQAGLELPAFSRWTRWSPSCGAR